VYIFGLLRLDLNYIIAEGDDLKKITKGICGQTNFFCIDMGGSRTKPPWAGRPAGYADFFVTQL